MGLKPHDRFGGGHIHVGNITDSTTLAKLVIDDVNELLSGYFLREQPSNSSNPPFLRDISFLEAKSLSDLEELPVVKKLTLLRKVVELNPKMPVTHFAALYHGFVLSDPKTLNVRKTRYTSVNLMNMNPLEESQRNAFTSGTILNQIALGYGLIDSSGQLKSEASLAPIDMSTIPRLDPQGIMTVEFRRIPAQKSIDEFATLQELLNRRIGKLKMKEEIPRISLDQLDIMREIIIKAKSETPQADSIDMRKLYKFLKIAGTDPALFIDFSQDELSILRKIQQKIRENISETADKHFSLYLSEIDMNLDNLISERRLFRRSHMLQKKQTGDACPSHPPLMDDPSAELRDAVTSVANPCL